MDVTRQSQRIEIKIVLVIIPPRYVQLQKYKGKQSIVEVAQKIQIHIHFISRDRQNKSVYIPFRFYYRKVQRSSFLHSLVMCTQLGVKDFRFQSNLSQQHPWFPQADPLIAVSQFCACGRGISATSPPWAGLSQIPGVLCCHWHCDPVRASQGLIKYKC